MAVAACLGAFFFIALVVIAPAASATSLEIQSLALDVTPKEEAITLQLSQPVAYKAFLLDNPSRLVIDLPPFHWKVNAAQLQSYRGRLISNIRYARFDANTSRVVMDLTAPVMLQTSTPPSEKTTRIALYIAGDAPVAAVKSNNSLNRPAPVSAAATTEIESERSSGNGFLPRHRARKQWPSVEQRVEEAEDTLPEPLPVTPLRAHSINIDQAQKPVSANIASGATPPVVTVGRGDTVRPLAVPVKPVPVTPAPVASAKPEKPLIVIDAGHGGQDPGTLGSRKSREKMITLRYAHALRDALLASGKYRVRLTRDDDRFIRLPDRVTLARKWGGDLFVSLHADSAPSGKARGLSVYTLSEEASDAEAAALAERENRVDFLADVPIATEDKEVAGILIDLVRRDTKNKSVELAEALVQSVRQKQVPLLPNTHRFAGFAVLKAPDIPSALVEIGFLSNPEEERLINTSAYRSKVVRGIADGINRYFQRYE